MVVVVVVDAVIVVVDAVVVVVDAVVVVVDAVVVVVVVVILYLEVLGSQLIRVRRLVVEIWARMVPLRVVEKVERVWGMLKG